MPLLRTLAALACCVPLVACAAPPWKTFRWEDARVIPGGPAEHAALFLPFKLNGHSCLAQLDTGMNASFQWHGALADSGVDITAELDGTVVHVRADQAVRARIEQDDCAAIASVGNAFFDNGTLILDLKNQR